MVKTIEIKPATGKLGVLTPGMGAVATTFVAGVYAVQKGLGKPIGSLTQMGTIRLGKRTDKRIPFIKDFVPLADLNDLVFGGWDIFPDDMYEAAIKVGVLEKEILNGIRSELKNVKPRPAVFDQNYVKRLNGTYVKKNKTKTDLADQLRKDIQDFFSIVLATLILRAFQNLPILDQLSTLLGPTVAYRSLHFWDNGFSFVYHHNT